jgi:hypothetical protein
MKRMESKVLGIDLEIGICILAHGMLQEAKQKVVISVIAFQDVFP